MVTLNILKHCWIFFQAAEPFHILSVWEECANFTSLSTHVIVHAVDHTCPSVCEVVSLCGFAFYNDLGCWSSFFGLCCVACGILVPQPGIEPARPVLGAWSPNPWTARGSPNILSHAYRPLVYLLWRNVCQILSLRCDCVSVYSLLNLKSSFYNLDTRPYTIWKYCLPLSVLLSHFLDLFWSTKANRFDEVQTLYFLIYLLML